MNKGSVHKQIRSGTSVSSLFLAAIAVAALAVLLFASVCQTEGSSADDGQIFTDGSLKYEIISDDEKTVMVAKGDYEGVVSIPDTISGYTVIGVVDGAFYGCEYITYFTEFSNDYLFAVDGILYQRSDMSMLCLPGSYDGKAHIPENIERISLDVLKKYHIYDCYGNEILSAYGYTEESIISSQAIAGSTLKISNKVCVRDEILCARFYIDQDHSFYKYFNYGDVVSAPESEVKVVKDGYVFTLISWGGFQEGKQLFDNVTFIAELLKTHVEPIVTFHDRFGNVFYQYSSEYGCPVVLPSSNPIVKDTKQFKYEFAGWDGYVSEMVATSDLDFYPIYNITVVGKFTDFSDNTFYYYDQLDPLVEQKMYKTLKALKVNVTNATFSVDMTMEQYLSVKENIGDSLNRGYYAFLYDEPQFYWGNGGEYSTSIQILSLTKIRLTIDFDLNTDTTYFPNDGWDRITSELKKIDIDTTSTYSKVQSIYAAVTGMLNNSGGRGDIYTALALGDHSVDSRGYANTFKLLCDMYGVDCVIGARMSGTVYYYNYVEMDDGKWYLVDCSAGEGDTVFLAGESTIISGGRSAGAIYQYCLNSGYLKFTAPRLSETAYDERELILSFVWAQGSEELDPIAAIIVKAGDFVNIRDYDLPGYSLTVYKDGIEVTEPFQMNADTTLSMNYSMRKYKVKLMENGGSAVSDLELSYGEVIKLPTVKRDCYTFDGWYCNGYLFEGTSMPAHDIVLVAHWSADMYKVFYTVDGIKTGEFETYAVGEMVNIRGKFVIEGYTVSDWSVTESFFMPGSNVTITATSKLTVFNVKYLVNDEQYGEIETYVPGAEVTLREKYSEYGYDVTDWSSDDIVLTSVFSMPYKDVTITATKAKIVCTVIYYVNGEQQGDTENYDYGATVTLREKYTKEGYDSTDWESQDIQLSKTFVIEVRTVAITATCTINTYSVTYYLDDEIWDGPDFYEYGKLVDLLDKATRVGYTVSDWESEEIPTTKVFKIPAKDVVFKATSMINKYTVYYKVDNEQVLSEVHPYDDLVAIQPKYDKTGYTVSEWDITSSFRMPNYDVTIRATSTINSYALTYIFDNVQYGEVTYHQYGSTVTVLPKIQQAGYTISDWESNDPSVKVIKGKIVMPADDVILISVKSVETHKVTYYLNDELYDEKIHNYGDKVFVLNKYEKIGFSTTDWVTSDVAVPAGWFTIGDKDIVFRATSVPGTYAVNYYVDDQLVYTDMYGMNDNVTVRDPYVKTGYTVTNWTSKDVEISNGHFKITGYNVSLTAVTKINTYGVVYKLNGMTMFMDYYEYASEVTVREKEVREGYTISEWSVTGKFTMPDKDVLITATSTVNSYTITFDTAGGSEIESIAVDYGASISMPENPVREGYEFSKWLYEGAEFKLTVMPAKDLNLVAEWIKATVPETIEESETKKVVSYSTNDVGMTKEAVATLLKNDKDVAVKMSNVAIDMPSTSFQKLTGNDSFTIKANVSSGIESKELLEKLSGEKKAIAEKAVVVEINVSTTGQRTELGTVKVSIPYTLSEGQSADSLIVYYISNNGELEKLGGTYEGGILTFETSHFSTFAVCNGSLTDSGSQDSNGNMALIIGGAVAVIAIVCIAAFVLTRKH